MNAADAIFWFKKAIDVYETFPVENDMRLEMYQIAVDALKKQIPTKPLIWRERDYFSDDNWGYECPSCRNQDIDYPEHHCICGQALDWDWDWE